MSQINTFGLNYICSVVNTHLLEIKYYEIKYYLAHYIADFILDIMCQINHSKIAVRLKCERLNNFLKKSSSKPKSYDRNI